MSHESFDITSMFCGIGETDSKVVDELSEYDFIYSLLARGEENAIKMEQLSLRSGKTEREVRKCVEQGRRAGKYILSSNNGYFLPSVDDSGQLSEKGYLEAKRYCGRSHSMGKAIFIASIPAEKLCREYERNHSEYQQISMHDKGYCYGE